MVISIFSLKVNPLSTSNVPLFRYSYLANKIKAAYVSLSSKTFIDLYNKLWQLHPQHTFNNQYESVLGLRLFTVT